MNPNRNNNDNNENERRDWSWWEYGAAAAAAATAVGGLAYMLTRNTDSNRDNRQQLTIDSRSEDSSYGPRYEGPSSEQGSVFSRIGDLLQPLVEDLPRMEDVVHESSSVPSTPCITNLNSLLADIYERYIALKSDDFKLHYRVFNEVFLTIHRKMKEVDKYYNRYSSNVQFAGSHYDRLRIKKPDEFDVDIVIGLPVNFSVDPFNPEESDIVIEQNGPGFVQLRAGVQYQKILVRDGVDCFINRTAYEWLDDRKYILRSKFTSWFKSVVYRALNQLPKKGFLPICYVDEVAYTIRTSESGPAWTLLIEAPGFKLDVDLVPAFRFPEDRWLEGRSYRSIPPEWKRGYWMVVPKPNKGGNTVHDEQRSWRVALQDQEKQFLHNTYNLRQTIRLMKKFRDAQKMDKIASYYIKTLFLWEYEDLKASGRSDMWKKCDIATLFKYMLRKFSDALDKKEIPYFWNRRHNLIANVNQCIINEYKLKVTRLLSIMDDSWRYKEVAKYLLTDDEYEEYKRFL